MKTLPGSNNHPLQNYSSFPRSDLRLQTSERTTRRFLDIMDSNKNKGLLEVIDSFDSTRKEWVELLEESPQEHILKRGCGIIWYHYERLSLKAIFVDGDVKGYFICVIK